MCDCKTVIEGKLKARFVEQSPDAKEHEARLTGYALIFGEKLIEKGAMDAELKAKFPLKKGGEKQKTIKHSMIFTFCPFCGIKYEG
jgi:hypothetical protein